MLVILTIWLEETVKTEVLRKLAYGQSILIAV